MVRCDVESQLVVVILIMKASSEIASKIFGKVILLFLGVFVPACKQDDSSLSLFCESESIAASVASHQSIIL